MDEMNNPYSAQGPGAPGGSPGKAPGLAIASMVLGIVSVVLCCCYYYISLPCGILAIIFGILVLRRGPAGKGMSIAGIACGAVSIVLAVIVILFASVGMAALLSEFPEFEQYF